jgi:ABC-type uncharacterized transport system substrate-binding protein
MAVLRRLSLAFLIVAALSAFLLWSDRPVSRRAPGPTKRVALVMLASVPTMEAAARGVLDGLAEGGFTVGDNLSIEQSHAEGDLATLNQIAALVTSGDADLVVTLSTPAAQVLHRNNRSRKPHVYGVVADPPSAGLDIDPENLADHPEWSTGLGTRLPVEDLFAMVRAAAPGLRTLGVAWNPSEKNAEIFLAEGKRAADALGFTLIDANAPSSADVRTAVDSLVARGAEAIWVLPDATTVSAISAIAQAARLGRVPIVASVPCLEEHGVALALGGDYRELGRDTGRLAARVLAGEDTADIPVGWSKPTLLSLNLAAFPEGWIVDPAWERDADTLVARDGSTVRSPVDAPEAALATVRPRSGRGATIRVVTWADTPLSEESIRGVKLGLEAAGLVDGTTASIEVQSAQLDAATLNTIVADCESRPPDAIVAITTPALQAVIAKVKRTPVVFTGIASPILAGAGTSKTDHLPNVTGVSSEIDVDRMARLVRTILPQAKTVATVMNPSEVNSVYHRDLLVEAMRKVGIEVRSFAADRPADVSVAADAMASSGVDAIVQISDALSASSFPAIATAARRAHRPLFSFLSDHARKGSTLVVSRDYVDLGQQAAAVVVRILDGADPATIPFQDPVGSRLLLNEATARTLGLAIPESILRETDERIAE